MNFLQRNILLYIVFLTGASVLIVEIVAVRILSPYYGNTIYTVSSVISVILAALSLGYYVGGRLADRWPHPRIFFNIIFVSGLSVFIIQLLTTTLLPSQGHRLSLMIGPLVSALVLFFLPSFLLGLLSPFAIKLQQQKLPQRGIGRISGEVFFYSTLGSILSVILLMVWGDMLASYISSRCD